MHIAKTQKNKYHTVPLKRIMTKRESKVKIVKAGKIVRGE
jgi:hypothetical protein